MEQELLTLPEHLSSPLVFSGVRVTRSLVLYVCFVDRCLSFCTFSCGHCVVCSSIYGFRLPVWYLQALLVSHRVNFTIITKLQRSYAYVYSVSGYIFKAISSSQSFMKFIVFTTEENEITI